MDTLQIKLSLDIAVHNLITEEELQPITAQLKEKGIDLEYKRITRGPQALAFDWLQPVVALYVGSEIFRSLVQSIMFDVFKFCLTSIIKTVASRTYYKLTSRTSEDKKGAITIVINTPEKASAFYSFEGVVSDTKIEKSLDAFVKSVEKLQPDTDKQNKIHATFNINSDVWTLKTMKQILQEFREVKEKSEKQ